MENLADFIKFRKICLENAGTALNSAKVLQHKKANHIAFHLCTLALEEIGKVIICWSNYCRSMEKGDDKTMLVIDDHIKKIFWALWWPSFGAELLTTEQMNENRSFASTIHKRRLESLYTELDDHIPAHQKIQDEELLGILRMVEARLQMALDDEITERPVSNEMEAFMLYTNEPDKRAFIFGQEAQLKLIEIGGAVEWVKWLVEKFKTEEQEMNALLEEELSREVDIDSAEAMIPKWEIKIKLNSAMHSIRPNVLEEYNEKFPMFRLNKGADNKTLLLTLTLFKHVQVNAVWHFGFIMSRIYVTALNIATNGVFWWRAPVDLDKFYESIRDLESKKKVEAILVTKLHWPESTQTLRFEDLVLTNLVNNFIVKCYNKPAFIPFQNYMHVLSMMAKNDVHLRFEPEMFRILFITYKDVVSKYQKLKQGEDYGNVGFHQLDGMLTNREYYDQILKYGELMIGNSEELVKPITLTEVLAIKQYLGLYLLTLAVRDKHGDDTLTLTNNTDKETT